MRTSFMRPPGALLGETSCYQQIATNRIYRATMVPDTTAPFRVFPTVCRGLVIEAGGLEVQSGGLLVTEDGGNISTSSTSADPLAVSATSES